MEIISKEELMSKSKEELENMLQKLEKKHNRTLRATELIREQIYTIQDNNQETLDILSYINNLITVDSLELLVAMGQINEQLEVDE